MESGYVRPLGTLEYSVVWISQPSGDTEIQCSLDIEIQCSLDKSDLWGH